MDINVVRQRLYDYVRVAEEKKLKAIYTMIESEINNLADPLDDKYLMTELKNRNSEMKSGKVKTYTLEETKSMPIMKSCFQKNGMKFKIIFHPEANREYIDAY